MIIMNLFPRRLAAALAGLALLATASACTSDGGSAVNDDQTTVVVGAYPFEFVTERIAGDMVEVTNLLAPGADGHDLELSPQQVATVGQADLLVYQSKYQASFDAAVDQQASGRVLDTADFLELRPAAGHGHADDEHAQDEDADGHDHGSFDPHVWLDPMNIAEIGNHVAAELSELDPDNATHYQANAEALTADMTALDGDFATGLVNCRTITFVTNHAAFGYLADRYALHMVGISGLSTEEEPSPARIAEVQQIAQDNDLTTIFYETTVSPKVAEIIAADLGLETDVLDPLETHSDESRGDNYIEVMHSNLQALRTANGCQ